MFAEILLQGPRYFIVPALDKQTKHRTNTTLAAAKEKTEFRKVFDAEFFNQKVL
jgi:hypothetical protein